MFVFERFILIICKHHIEHECQDKSEGEIDDDERYPGIIPLNHSIVAVLDDNLNGWDLI